MGLHLEINSAKSKIRFTTERTSSSCKGAARRNEPRAPDQVGGSSPANRWSVTSIARGHGSGDRCSDRSVLELGPRTGSGLEWLLFDWRHGWRLSSDRRVGGDEETRTPDPLLAKEMLCQLSYVPLPVEVVGVSGLEPETSALSGQCSNQLS